jgi:hypothetical protein
MATGFLNKVVWPRIRTVSTQRQIASLLFRSNCASALLYSMPTSIWELQSLAKLMKSKSETEEIALKRIRGWPGCRGTSTVVLTLDDDGEWSFEVSDAGSADAKPLVAPRLLSATRCMTNLI